VKLERIEVGGLKFDVRPDTSDRKAITEVVERRSYGRHDFTPAEGEIWSDLGANVGAFSVWAASQDPRIMVYAYEPDPDMCELVWRNAKLNKVQKQIEITQAAVVADDRTEVTLHCNVARGNVWRNSIERHWRGEQDIEVPAIHIAKVMGYVQSAGVAGWMKMDIEGTEMPILEWLLKPANRHLLPEGMVFEWSFDVDPSLERFRKVTAKLERHYEFVNGTKLQESPDDMWQQEWFPPCRLVYAR
jgi:FkbM family methyltransferase